MQCTSGHSAIRLSKLPARKALLLPRVQCMRMRVPPHSRQESRVHCGLSPAGCGRSTVASPHMHVPTHPPTENVSRSLSLSSMKSGIHTLSMLPGNTWISSSMSCRQANRRAGRQAGRQAGGQAGGCAQMEAGR